MADGKGSTVTWTLPSALSHVAFLIRCRRSRRLERERDLLGFLLAERDALRRRPELLVPRFDRVGARRQIPELELPVVLRHGEVGMRQHADVGVHPAVHVALE